MYVLLRVANYGINSSYGGISDIALYLQSEVDAGYMGKAVEKGLDIAIDNVKQNQDYDENGEAISNDYKRSIKIDGDVKASLAARPIKYLLKDL